MKELDCQPLYKDAEFYDAEFADRSYDLDFYLRQAVRIEGSVLELACGTGRIAIPIAQAGLEVAGLDVSQPMLERARRKASAQGLRVDWHLADCRNFKLGRSFDLIIMVSNALQHLHDADSLAASFTRVREHLKPGGRFIFDVMNPDPRKLERPYDLRYRHKTFHESKGDLIEVDARSRYDPAQKLLRFDLFYSQGDRRDFLVKNVTMRCLFPEEVDALCRAGGFEIENRLGDFDARPFSASAPKQIIICRQAQE